MKIRHETSWKECHLKQHIWWLLFPDIVSFTSFCSVKDKNEKNNSCYDSHVEINMSTDTCFWKLHDISYLTQCQINWCYQSLIHVYAIIQDVCSKEIKENFYQRIFIHTIIIAQYQHDLDAQAPKPRRKKYPDIPAYKVLHTPFFLCLQLYMRTFIISMCQAQKLIAN